MADETSDDEDRRLLNANIKKVSYNRGASFSGTVMTLYFLAYYIYMPLLAQYVRARVGGKYLNGSALRTETNFCKRNDSDGNSSLEDRIQEESSTMLLHFSWMRSFPALVIVPLLGTYSDYIGRRTLFLVPLIGCLLKALISLAITYWNLDLELFYVAFACDGLGGSVTTFILANCAYMADISPPFKKRTIAMVILLISASWSNGAGKLTTGLLLQNVGFVLPMLINASTVLVATLLVAVLLKETMTSKKAILLSPLILLKATFGFYLVEDTKRKRLYYLFATCMFAFGILVRFGRDNVETLYLLARPYCFSPTEVGYFGASRVVATSIGAFVAVNVFSLFLRDELLVLLGLCSQIGGLVFMSTVTVNWMLWFVPVVAIFEANAAPICRSLISRMTSPTKQGAIFSALASVEAVFDLLGNTLFNTVYTTTVSEMRGMVYLIMITSPVISACMTCVFMVLSKRDPTLYHAKEEETEQKVS